MTRLKLSELPHIDHAQIGARTVLLMPLWDGSSWQTWVPDGNGMLLPLKIMGVVHSDYIALEAAHVDDLVIPLMEFMWQRASWPEVAREVRAIAHDIHQVATSAAKLDHFYLSRDAVDHSLLATFVASEVEHLIVVARSMFDLFQAGVAHFWNDRVVLIEKDADATKKRHRLPSEFSKVVLAGDKLKTADDLTNFYALPPNVAAMYAKHAPFFASLRSSRDSIVHSGSTPDSIYITEKGFCVSPTARHYRDFPWQEAHHYNDNIVSLLPWVARTALGPVEACHDILSAYARAISFPEPISPSYRVFLRDPSNPALMGLHRAARGERTWWQIQPQSDDPVGSRDEPGD